MKNKQRYYGRLAYNGTHYLGFQRQPEGKPTVQREVEWAISLVTRETVKIYAAGRTDAGVHARGQVIAFDSYWKHRPADLWRAINANLPHDIVLRDLQITNQWFHPRYDATSRRYRYQFYTAPIKDPLWEGTSWYVGQLIDPVKMQQAANQLIGTHDFATFGHPTQGTSTTRNFLAAYYHQGAENQLYFVFEASGFLKRMIRRIMRTLVNIGQGNMSLAEFEAAFAARDRSRVRGAAPPHGLSLEHVTYDAAMLSLHREDYRKKWYESQNLDTKS